MGSKLFFICPTDYLEPKLKLDFGANSLFYSSLGNSVEFNFKTMLILQDLIRKHQIDEVSFVLSLKNRIIKDALGLGRYSDLRGLGNLSKQLNGQSEFINACTISKDYNYVLLSYFLNSKIKQLESRLISEFGVGIKIIGEIYDENNKSFTSILPFLLCFAPHQVN